MCTWKQKCVLPTGNDKDVPTEHTANKMRQNTTVVTGQNCLYTVYQTPADIFSQSEADMFDFKIIFAKILLKTCANKSVYFPRLT